MSTAAKKSTKTEISVDDVTEQVAILRDDISALTSTIAKLMEDKSRQVAEKGKETAEMARETVEARAADAADQARDAKAYVDDMVAKNPTGALAVAAGVGFLVGMLNSRR